MTALAIVPAWVAPAHAQVVDCHRITHAVATQTGSQRTAGVCATISWITGGQASPVTAREGEPTVAAARAELMVADTVAAGGPPLPPELWSELGVDRRDAVTSHVEWASGAAAALGWLLGVHDRPPVRLPRRLQDGSIPTVEQLYAEYAAATWCEPEDRRAARSRAEQDAALYRRLAALADSAR